MLVLSRKLNESIVFPDLDIEIEVIKVQGDRVRLGIKAPKSVKCHRKEVQRMIDQQAAETNAG